MKYCPACQTKYDEEILRFCTKDGSPLIDENQPKFTELPSESVDDYGEETVIRRKTPEPIPQPGGDGFEEKSDFSESTNRIVIPATEREQQIRTKTSPSIRDTPLPKESNTLVVVLLTIIGTIVVISAAFGVFWLLGSKSGSENINVNTNFNAFDGNINANEGLDNTLFDGNFNFNANSNLNINANSNVNSNTNTKTPTPSPSLSPTPTRTPVEENTNTESNSNTSTPTPRPSITPRPSVSPSATPAPSNNNTNTKPVNVGALNDRALTLQTPSYPLIAKEMRASGKVQVQVVVDEKGNVSSAKAVSGHPLLRSSAENAARSSRFNPVSSDGRAVKAVGFVVYNFVRPN